jgi:hypothetical protein
MAMQIAQIMNARDMRVRGLAGDRIYHKVKEVEKGKEE